MEEQRYIENYINIRYCYKYKGVSFELCECGNPKQSHEEIPKSEEIWSIENNTKLKPCNVYGSINFDGYDNATSDKSRKFIRFNCINERMIDQTIFDLITMYWRFPFPKLIISVYGGYKRMLINQNREKKKFKQGLIEIMKKDSTWIIGGGFNVGIHKLISEAVYEYRLHHEEAENKVKLIGISTWGAVQNNQCLLQNQPTYTTNNTIEKGKVPLDANYDCFLFCDDGSEKKYGKETDFRLDFEKYVQKHDNIFAVQILYEGGKLAIENSYKSLSKCIPLVVIKRSGRASDLICQVMDLNKRNCKKEIYILLEEYEDLLELKKEDIEKFHNYLSKMLLSYKKQIIIHDFLDKNMKFDDKILEAIISSQENNELESTLNLTVRFNCHQIAENKIFQNKHFTKLSSDILNKNFLEVLGKNRPEFVQLFLENNFKIEEFLDETVLLKLYIESLGSDNCRCHDLIGDLISSEDKSIFSKKINMKLLQIIYKIICKLSGNILEQRKENLDIYNLSTRSFHKSTRKESIVLVSFEGYMTHKMKSHVTSQDLFLWALLSGYTEIAIIFWKIGKDHVGSALVGSIILNKMKNLLLKRGYSDMSEKLSEASIKFQEMAIVVITEAYNKSKYKTYELLTRTLERWNKMTCLQIAISGNLLDFLNTSACRSYTRKAWMGELLPLLPTWKILLTIPFSFVFIKPLVIPSQKKLVRDNQLEITRTPDISLLSRQRSEGFPVVTFHDALAKFYQAPKVKFFVHLFFYIVFLLIFTYQNLVELKALIHISKIKERPAETITCVYVFGFLIEEIRQVFDQERTGNIHKLKAYLSGSWNIYDLLVIFLFCVSVILRYTLSENYFLIARCFFSVTLSMFIVRVMQFYFISPSIGPKVIMIRKMIVDIFFFLIIFALFILSYGTLVQALQNPNREWSYSILTDIFYFPYFQTYGELMLDTIKVSNCTSHICPIGDATITIGFAIFLLLTNILLVNLLIAMFGHTFKTIQEDSEKFFSFIQIQLVEEFHEKPLLPVPLNIFYYIFIAMQCFGNFVCNKKKSPTNSFLVKNLSEKENFKMAAFEQLCMESSILDIPSSMDMRNSSVKENLSEQVLGCMEKINDYQDSNQSHRSIRSRSTYNSRLEKLEILIEKMKL